MSLLTRAATILFICCGVLSSDESEAWFVWCDGPCSQEIGFIQTGTVSCYVQGTVDSEHYGGATRVAAAMAWANNCTPYAILNADGNGSAGQLSANSNAQYGSWDIPYSETVYPNGSRINFGGGSITCAAAL